jgi:hypothetical protein
MLQTPRARRSDAQCCSSVVVSRGVACSRRPGAGRGAETRDLHGTRQSELQSETHVTPASHRSPPHCATCQLSSCQVPSLICISELLCFVLSKNETKLEKTHLDLTLRPQCQSLVITTLTGWLSQDPSKQQHLQQDSHPHTGHQLPVLPVWHLWTRCKRAWPVARGRERALLSHEAAGGANAWAKRERSRPKVTQNAGVVGA